jgi:hypothetical protein
MITKSSAYAHSYANFVLMLPLVSNFLTIPSKTKLNIGFVSGNINLWKKLYKVFEEEINTNDRIAGIK